VVTGREGTACRAPTKTKCGLIFGGAWLNMAVHTGRAGRDVPEDFFGRAAGASRLLRAARGSECEYSGEEID
jgi:hypothetical protein